MMPNEGCNSASAQFILQARGVHLSYAF
jgi:hypothetical protein